MGFAMANTGGGLATRERVGRFVDMYVNRWTTDMGDQGRGAITRLLAEGARGGLCPAVGAVEVV
jgi:predicted solute-binding protein